MAHPFIASVSISTRISTSGATSAKWSSRHMANAWKGAAGGLQTLLASSQALPGSAMTATAASLIDHYQKPEIRGSGFSSFDLGFDFHPASNFFYYDS